LAAGLARRFAIACKALRKLPLPQDDAISFG
jgi:hypothetical protein